MRIIKIWVPITWRSGLPYCESPSDWGWWPDMPDGIRWEADALPEELDPNLPVRTARPDSMPQRCQGDPAVKYCRVRINATDLPKVRQYLQQKYGKPDLSADVPEEDRLLIGVCAVPGGPMRNPDAVEAIFEAIRDEVVNAPLARRQRIKRVLIHAVHRGLPAARAERIRQRLNLPLVVSYGR